MPDCGRGGGHDLRVPWGELAARAPDLAEFGARRLGAAPAYLATVDDRGAPRVHPVTPIVGDGLFVFMDPTSPRGRDIEHRGLYALHGLVPDSKGTGADGDGDVALPEPRSWRVPGSVS